jgi:hypothetical protein
MLSPPLLHADRTRLRAKAALLGLLLLVHAGAGFLHPCCLEGSEHPSVSMAEPHGGASHTERPPLGPEHGSGNLHHGAASQHADGHEQSDCEGACGLCCSTPDEEYALAVPSAVLVPAPIATHSEPARLQATFVPRLPAYFLPFANGPPGSSTLLG